jgi:transposase-like protein
MTLIDVHVMFSSDAKCRELLKRLRWPNGPECLRCKGPVTSLNTEKDLLYCKDCDYQFTVTAGTVFHDSHLPLLTWFVVTYLLCESRKGISANQVKRMFKCSYKTAWYLCHRIRHAMREVDRPMLDGIIEIDETYVGGKAKNMHRSERARKIQGRGTVGKEIVIGIRQRGGSLRFFHASDVESGTLADYLRENVSADVDVIISDDFRAYDKAVGNGSRHKTVNHSAGVYVVGDTHTNTIESAFSLLKRGIMGTWHKVSAKHLPAYLDEMTFRFDRRKKSDLWIDTLRHMVTADPLTFKNLTAERKPKPVADKHAA